MEWQQKIPKISQNYVYTLCYKLYNSNKDAVYMGVMILTKNENQKQYML